MARIRTIRPEFFLHETLSELPAITRLAFIGLWTLADREGRLEDRPKRIRATLFPYDNLDVDAIIGELRSGGFVVRYEVDGERYIAIPAFKKHQHVHVKEPASILPAPGEHGASTGPAPGLSSEVKQQSQPTENVEAQFCTGLAPGEHESRPLDSLMLDAGKLDAGELDKREVAQPKRSPNGSRLARDWECPDDWWQWAQAQGLNATQAALEAEKFADYWHSVAGAKGRKCDWQATWRNWIRRALENGKGNGKRFETAADRMQRACAEPAQHDDGRTIEGHAEVVGANGGHLRVR